MTITIVLSAKTTKFRGIGGFLFTKVTIIEKFGKWKLSAVKQKTFRALVNLILINFQEESTP